MNPWHDFDPKRFRPESFLAVIEIPKGSKKKYELDKESGLLILDRILYTSTHYPANYGFIPRTFSEDKDPLDVLVICDETFDPMVLVKCKPIGVVRMIDEHEKDEKIIAVCEGDPTMNCFTDISELPKHRFDEISHFFKVYKQLEGKETVVTEVLGVEAAKETIQQAIDTYEEIFVR